MGDITKLPKWAQDHIRVLEMRVRENQHHINELAKPAMQVTGEITHGNYGREKHCEFGDQITFYVDVADGEDFHRAPQYLQVQWRDPKHPEFGLELHGSDCVRIDPRASNLIWVTLGRPAHG